MSPAAFALADSELKAHLERLVARFNTPAFIADDPIAIPHRYSERDDIAIAGLLVAVLAWGQRPTIVANGMKLMQLLDDAPHAFVLQHTAGDLKRLRGFVHRTFNGADLVSLVRGLRHVYAEHGGLEAVVTGGVRPEDPDVRGGLIALHEALVGAPGFAARTHKHVADIRRGSAAKRLNMWLRWLVRRDRAGVDFGLWRGIRPDQLLCPLDLHTGRVARALGLLRRSANDFKAVVELTEALRALDPADPVKYDLALFGLGASGELELTG